MGRIANRLQLGPKIGNEQAFRSELQTLKFKKYRKKSLYTNLKRSLKARLKTAKVFLEAQQSAAARLVNNDFGREKIPVRAVLF